MHIPPPFLPAEIQPDKCGFRVRVLGREAVFGSGALPCSLTSGSTELLASPVRLTASEDGEETVWREGTAENESEVFIHSRTDEEITLMGALASRRFIADVCVRIGYDGNIRFDLRVMPNGRTVAQVFGLAETESLRYRLDKLWLDIPLRRELCPFFSLYPNSPYTLEDGTVVTETAVSNSGRVPGIPMYFPFKPLFWLGSEEQGIGFFAESERNWQPQNEARVLELVPRDDCLLLRAHLLDSHPQKWNAAPEDGCYRYEPISFSFGLQVTPVKPFPSAPYPEKALHLDCFRKIGGDYWDFLSSENRFDRLKEKGVTTLILHEKWNREQNWFEPSEPSIAQLNKIVSECHRRGIRVLTYFGYEISTLSPLWSEKASDVTLRAEQNNESVISGGWYRVPFQRAYKVCYNTEWSDRFINGITGLMDTCHIDGVYLDGTSRPEYCTSLRHGCGWYDTDGRLRGTYPVLAVRTMFEKLYREVHARGGVINVHAFGMQNFTALPYIDISWYGENLQFDYCAGRYGDVPTDTFRSEYTGRNMGVPVEFIAYENRPVWTFENAVALSLVHGILPRPNDIEGPLELMSGIWRILDRFPIDRSEWRPYWSNMADTDSSAVKVSYYRYTGADGHTELLLFAANLSREKAENVRIRLNEEGLAGIWSDLNTGSACDPVVSLGGYGHGIFSVR